MVFVHNVGHSFDSRVKKLRGVGTLFPSQEVYELLRFQMKIEVCGGLIKCIGIVNPNNISLRLIVMNFRVQGVRESFF